MKDNATPPFGADPCATEFRLNGASVAVSAPPGERLSQSLRERLGSRDVKIGCNAGDCGACTVLVDGAPVCACLMPTARVAGASVETQAGLVAHDPLAQRLADSFHAHQAAQCGICTPGMMVAAMALLRAVPSPTAAQVEDASAAGLEQGRRAPHGRGVNPVLPVEQRHAGSLAGLDHRARVRDGDGSHPAPVDRRDLGVGGALSEVLADVGRQGLGAGDGLPRRGGALREGPVEVVRHAQVDELDVLSREEGIQVRHGLRDPLLTGEGRGLVGVAGGHGEQATAAAGEGAIAAGARPREEAAADEADAEGSGAGHAWGSRPANAARAAARVSWLPMSW